MTTLFDPLAVGALSLTNRIAMAPLTRNRAAAGYVPGPHAQLYYTQRATAGLIIAEGTQISPFGQGYLDTPGIYTPAQVAGWRRVTDAVHAQGGRIVVQLWHVGRISHTSLLPGGGTPVSPTARQANTKTFVKDGFAEVSAPRALRVDEIACIVADFRRGARFAIDAGFDGVELHGANGYLIDQFLRDSINDRTDEYGGSIENRTRFAVEAMQAVIEEIGAERTGIRLSPIMPGNDAQQDSDPQAVFNRLVDRLAPLKPMYIHVIEGSTGAARDVAPFDWEDLRGRYKRVHPQGAWMVNNGYTRDMALEVIASGRADVVAFGRSFISNPDLVRRLREDLPLAQAHRATMYGGGAEGYTDYPFYEATATA